MLTGIQKLQLAKQLKQLRSQIKSNSIKGIEKLNLAKEIKAIRAQITGKVKKLTSRLDDLIKGKYDNLTPPKFIALVREISEEENDFESVKNPVINYVQKNIAA
ncbi:hypothetical protein [Photobacterium toruni]|uniref:Uncharacterized protein n=1 Tax=Photobacterium toruni TaxID=1935446 RepID=A0A1T4UJS7_9GAMM|nr:hypothetical protein [Photobacterium toruni]SKA52939.1 hypothetical protein CZ814_03372 [Photobacterium toruni]